MSTITVYETNLEQAGIRIRNSDGKWFVSKDAEKLLRFMRYSASQTIRVTWDLDGTIAPILRLLPRDILDRLSKFDDELVFQGHELYYLPDRLFRVGKSRFYGIRSFWGRLTDDIPMLEQTGNLANKLLSALGICGMPNPRKLTSTIAVFEDSEMGRKLYAELPRGHNIPEEDFGILEYAGKADKKDWISNHCLGFFGEGEIYDYDISACYPGLAVQLPDLRDLDIWSSNKLGENEKQAAIGIVKGSFYINPEHEYAHCSPIIGEGTGDIPGNPLGRLPEDCYVWDEVEFIESHGMGEFNFKSGWFASPKPGVTPRRPFKAIMETMYNIRTMSPLASSVGKAVSNSLIGKLIETKVSGEYGPLRNDLYHALITARARVQVAKFLVDNKVQSHELVCVQTDGVKLTREISLPADGMGNWRCNGSSPTILLSPYKVYSQDAKPYRLTYSDVIEMINEHPLSQTYSKQIKHRLTLVQAIRQYDDISRVGEEIVMPDSFDLVALGLEQNRRYAKLPKTGSALLNSKYKSEPVILVGNK